MLPSTSLESMPTYRPMVPPANHAPPYSPTLINLNQKYNMSANSLTEALLLLSGMYISLVQPNPGPTKIGLHVIFPKILSDGLNSVIIEPFKSGRAYGRNRSIQAAFTISSSYTRSEYAPNEILKMLCEDIFPKNTITVFYINSPYSLRQYFPPAASYLPRLIESLGLPVISYDTQFSQNSQPRLSIQLAPTMGQMMDVLFAFLKKFGWTDFSFLCTLSSGCQDEISYIKLKLDEYKRKPKLSVYGVDNYTYQLLSYVNFTNGMNETEVREKLTYELHKDSRISLVHGEGAQVKYIMDVAKQLGLTGKDYVWIFTSASITLTGLRVPQSYPLGSFIIGYEDSREVIIETVKTGINIWLDALNSLAMSSDMDNIDFNTGFSCDRITDDMSRDTNVTVKSPLFWKYGEQLYSYILKSKLPGGMEFDDYGVLKANKFFILNIQHLLNDTLSGSSNEDKQDKSKIGRPSGKGNSPQRGSSRPQPSRLSHDTDRPTHSNTIRDDKDDESPVFGNRESRVPSTRNKDTDSSSESDSGSEHFSSRDREFNSMHLRNRDRESPPSRMNDLDPSQSRDVGSDPSQGRSPANDKRPIFTGRNSLSRDAANKDFNSRFSRQQRTESPSTDDESGSSFPASRDAEATFHSGRSSLGKSRSNAAESGRSQAHSSDLSHYDASYRTFKTGTPPYNDPSQSSDFFHNDDPILASEISFPNRNDGHEGFNNHQDLIPSDKDSLTRSSSDTSNRERIRHRDRNNVHGSRFGHKGRVHMKGNTSNYVHENHDSSFHRRSRRDAPILQITKKIADWDGSNLTMYSITWPGGSSIPPRGKPEKYILKVVTWQEDPHVIYREMTAGLTENDTMCEINTVPCTVYNRDTQLHRTNGTRNMCCTGLCIDLLTRLGNMLDFDVELSEVADDGSYGSPLNANMTEWNGMIGMMLHKQADMAIGALSVTPERSVPVDFSVPFLQTGITIIVALRHGVISPTAFLEPYDHQSWSLILLFSVHATGASIFIFEWLSPYGLDQGKTSYSVHKFSLFRSFWLIWAMLFGASVSTDQPRGIASRFLANIWALFAVVFCASYTANLAAFMITKDTYHDLSGIQDWRLKNPHHVKPPFKFATIANSSTDLNIKKNYKDIHQYMKNEAQTDVKDAIRNLKDGKIEAFIYDSTTLEYEVGKDDGCKLKAVGKRIAETGYGVAFPKRSQWVKQVDRALLQLQENGEIERLQKHWLARACHNKKETGVSSHTLGILNFTSAFILLGSGVIFGVMILMLEHMYFRFGRKSLKKWDKCGCCSLVSLSMGQSLTFEQSVIEAMDYHKHHRCRDPLCETQLWKVKHDLDIALLKISQLRRQLASTADGAKGNSHGSSSNYDSPNQNGAARRRRQQVRDADSDKMDRSSNQPLLALEGKSETEDETTPVQTPKHRAGSYSQRSSYPAVKNKVASPDSGRYSYPEQGNARDNTSVLEDRPVSRMIKAPKKQKYPDSESRKMVDLDYPPKPPSFEEAITRYRSSSIDEAMTSSPSPQLPPLSSSPPTPAAPTSPYHSPQEGVSQLSGSNPDSSSPSSDDKRYEPFILDSPESPSFSSFSETSDNRLSCPGTLSKLSDEVPSTAVSQDMDSNFTSSPEMSKSLDDSNSFPHVAYHGTPFSNAQNKYPASVMDTMRPSILHEDVESDNRMLLLNSSKEDDNDVNTRRTRDNDANIYVNVDDINGRETAF